MIHVVDQRVGGLWPVGGLRPKVGGPPLTPAAPDPGLRDPYAAVPVGRHLAVADSGNDRIALIHRRTSATTKITSAGAPTGPPRGPRGVAITASGHVVIADTGNRRLLWSTSTVDEFVSGTADPAGWAAYGQASVDDSRNPGDFLAPANLAVDSTGRVWIADPGLARVVVIEDVTGAGWAEVTLPARVDGLPRQPYAVTADGPQILLTDLTAGEVWTIDADLAPTLLVSGATDGRLTAPVAIVAEADGFLVADAVGARIVRWRRDGAGELTHRGELAARGRPPGAPVFSRVTGVTITGGVR